MRSRGPSSPGCWPGQDDDDVIKLRADTEVTSMRPEQDGSDHDYPRQVADTGCQLRYREPGGESHDDHRSVPAQEEKPDARFIRD